MSNYKLSIDFRNRVVLITETHTEEIGFVISNSNHNWKFISLSYNYGQVISAHDLETLKGKIISQLKEL